MKLTKRIRQILEIIQIFFISPKHLTSNMGIIYSKIKENENKSKIAERGFCKGLPTIDLLDLFPNFNETIDPYSYLQGASFPIDLALLKLLARKYKKCDYLEIGTWRGESLKNIAPIAKTCTSISLSEKELRQKGFSEKSIKLEGFFSKNIKNTIYIKHDSQTFDFAKLKQKFDLIFIDGDHNYKYVKKDTKNMFKLLKNEDSIIIWHDYGSGFETINYEVFAGILDGTPKDKRKHLYHVSNTLCAIYSPQIPKNIKISFPCLPATPNKKFKIQISAKKLK